ncbi:Response regulator receiver domain [Geoglobus ahangari]|uniref:Response regulator receiver domain n=1 Tax=Geoglobus ahangari TaxID=113653 RepID=A0A0F7IDI3_9EURY|nr:response regulator [Geoglobus ahangari]AKG90978.1 Response regulator receiver domain [Geoglobus ahangari]NOY11569.1 response regulator [Archaeoglobi archaeon]
MKILVVDDDITMRELLRLMLKNHEVYEADNGNRAIAIYERFKPDVVLMDILMPGMDGIEATKEILKKDPDAIIIGISAFASNKGKDILEAGARDILEKPFTRKKLLELIEKHISAR